MFGFSYEKFQVFIKGKFIISSHTLNSKVFDFL